MRAFLLLLLPLGASATIGDVKAMMENLLLHSLAPECVTIRTMCVCGWTTFTYFARVRGLK